jgi:hypothetical protein
VTHADGWDLRDLWDYLGHFWAAVWTNECGACRAIVVAVPLAVLASLCAHVVLDWARTRTARAAAVCAAWVGGALVLAMIAARVTMLRPSDVFAAYDWQRSAAAVEWLVILVAATLELTILNGLLLLRLTRPSSPARTLANGLVVLVIVGIVPSALWLRELVAAQHFGQPRCACFFDRASFVRMRMESIDALLDHTHIALGGLGAIVVVAALWHRAKSAKPIVSSYRSLGVAALVALAGAGAFAATRGHAYDSSHPIAIGLAETERDNANLPPRRSSTCEPEVWGAVSVEVRADRVTLDHRAVTPKELGAELTTLRRNWAVLRPREPFPATLRVRVLAPTSARRLQSYLSYARAAGHDWAMFETSYPERIETGTLGTVTRWHVCSIGARLVAGDAIYADTDALLAAALDGTVEVPQIVLEGDD